MKNVLFVISGPSGVGKGTVAKRLCELNDNIRLSISCTTRQPRGSEIDGKDYFFITKEQFENKIKNEELLEYSLHFENYYGTPKDYVERCLLKNDVMLEIDVEGALAVKDAFPQAVLIMITPPSIDELKNRLIGRKTESEDKINLRLSRASFELGLATKYDYTVVNDDIERVCDEIMQILNKEKDRL